MSRQEKQFFDDEGDPMIGLLRNLASLCVATVMMLLNLFIDASLVTIFIQVQWRRVLRATLL